MLVHVPSILNQHINMKQHNRPKTAERGADKLIDAAAAAKALGVSANTIYAYVSRGLVRSTPNPSNPKASLYVAADIQTLIERKTRLRRPRAAAATALEFGLPVLKTHLTHFEDNQLFYRRENAVTWSQDATLEDTARLLWNTGEYNPFPTVQFDPRQLPSWSDTSKRFAHTRATDRASALLPLLTLQESPHPGMAGVPAFQSAARLLHAVAAACSGLEAPIRTPIHQTVAAAWGRPSASDVLRRSLVLLADHELNASTFAVRVVASTGARHTNCVLGGLAALSGAKHGAASERARNFLNQMSSPQDATTTIGERLDNGELIPGFGHFLYREGDPRAGELLRHIKLDPIAAATLAAVRDMIGVEPNVDFALVAIERSLKLPNGVALALFAIARTVGWLAHVFEQRAAGNLIRPRAEFILE